jgi:hypothetical protein
MSVVYPAENPRPVTVIALKVLAIGTRRRRRSLHGHSRRIAHRGIAQLSARYSHSQHAGGNGLLYIVNRYVSGTGLARIFASLLALCDR